jgi:hypothetical protein
MIEYDMKGCQFELISPLNPRLIVCPRIDILLSSNQRREKWRASALIANPKTWRTARFAGSAAAGYPSAER